MNRRDSTEDEERAMGLGTVVEYPGSAGEPQRRSPAPSMWNDRMRQISA
jgi:hypothetical protein